jgi:hypothetical protein
LRFGHLSAISGHRSASPRVRSEAAYGNPAPESPPKA